MRFSILSFPSYIISPRRLRICSCLYRFVVTVSGCNYRIVVKFLVLTVRTGRHMGRIGLGPLLLDWVRSNRPKCPERPNRPNRPNCPNRPNRQTARGGPDRRLDRILTPLLHPVRWPHRRRWPPSGRAGGYLLRMVSGVLR